MRPCLPFAAGSLLILSACSGAQTGQVAASIDGEEVTYTEINAELRSMQIPDGTSEQDAQKLALERIIDRRLMAQAARKEGLDRTPFFLLRERQLRDALLAQLLREQTEQTLSPADAAAIDQFVARNERVFAERKLLTLRQVSFDAPDDPRRLKALEDAASLDAVAAQLRRLDIPFERGTAQLDTAFMERDQRETILSMPDGKPFVLPEGSRITIAVLQSVQAAPLSAEAARPLAARLVSQRQRERSIGELISNLREEARIEYREEFEPGGPEPEG